MDNEKILKIIESSHFNFLIGSGASRNYLDTLSNIEELLTDLENETQENKSQKWYKVLEASIKFWYYEKCIKGNTKLIDNEFELSKEKLLDFNETLNNYINFLQALNIIVLKRKNNLLPKEVNIFTTNMDLFFDKNLDKLGLEFNDGFSGKFSQTFDTSNYQKSFFKNSSQYNISSELPLFNLFKLHGSITWDKSNEKEIKYNPNCDVLKILNKITLPKEHIISLISESNNEKEIKIKHKNYSELKKEVSSKKFEDFDITLFENFVTEYDKLVMINPTKEKFENTTLRLEYYEQIRMYSNILERENSVLFVTGFSFADEHIREITRRALNSNPTLLVIVLNFNESGKKEIENLFTKLKYKNLYTEFIGYDFKKVANSVFLKIAEELDLSIRIKASEDNNSKKENIKTRLTDEEQDK